MISITVNSCIDSNKQLLIRNQILTLLRDFLNWFTYKGNHDDS